MQTWLNRLWYERRTASWWLLPLSALFGIATAVRRGAYAAGLLKTVRLPVPVIVVGNVSVGGTGKTPLVCWLAVRLAAAGLRPGVVTRGYGGSVRAAQRIEPDADAARVGDEALLLIRRTQVPVAVGRDRAAAGQLLIDAGCNVIVSDDGLQHYRLARDCEVAVIDAVRGFGNASLLPAGPLRETPARLLRVGAVVLNGADESAAQRRQTQLRDSRLRAPGALPALHMRLEPDDAVSLRNGRTRPLRQFAGRRVHAIAGIGNPQRFFAMLESFGIQVAARAVSDHASLQARDISFDDELDVLMTEKDAVKCTAFAGEKHWYVPVSARFAQGEAAALLNLVNGAAALRGR